MLVFPNSKINLGLNIVQKRPDGFHNIETVFYHINWCDALEVIENTKKENDFEFSCSGKTIQGDLNSNLIYKAYELIRTHVSLPKLKVHLHKNIPMGAGLGGGSADAAFFINLLTEKFSLNLNLENKLQIANQLGADCAFFIENKPVYATEKGSLFSKCKIDLNSFYILIIFPNIHSNTKEAYHGVVPKASSQNPKQIVENISIHEWKNFLVNDFEYSIFKKYPLIADLKTTLYQQGAIYASLSGSGSAVFGIFDKKPDLDLYKNFESFLQTPLQINL
jgi:4-diphosphocytidyl-2-C-methyl-D-erythritol kinase